MLILIQLANSSITQVNTHQPADIAGAEPWLIFKEDGVKAEVVSGEY